MSLLRFCRKPIATVKPDDPVLFAAERMRQMHVGSVVVTDEAGRPVGILTDRDVTCRVVAERKDAAATPVREVMSSGVTVASEEDLIDDALLKMRRAGVRRLPLTGKDGRVVGLVSLDDLIVLLGAELGLTSAVVRSNRGP